jgi:hypothetical protein
MDTRLGQIVADSFHSGTIRMDPLDLPIYPPFLLAEWTEGSKTR